MKKGGLSDFADFAEDDVNCTQGIQWIKDVSFRFVVSNIIIIYDSGVH